MGSRRPTKPDENSPARTTGALVSIIGRIPALRAFFNDVGRADAGRLVNTNPFAGLRLRQRAGAGATSSRPTSARRRGWSHALHPGGASHHWNRVRCSVGLGNVDLYTATRHHFAWYAWNVLELDPADIAQHFGHQDGGALVRELYGHFDQFKARARIHAAFAQTSAPTPRPIRTAA